MKLHQIFGISQIFGGQNEASPNIWRFPNIWHSYKQQVTRKPVGFMQSCFFVLVSMWFPGHHMVSMCKPCGVLWKPCSVHLETMWCPHLKPCSVHLKTTWCPHGNHMVSTWKLCGIHLETMWCSCDNHVVSTWKPQGVNMETMWCPP